MIRVYIAGPMTGLPELNYAAFEEARVLLEAHGYSAESPTDNGAPETRDYGDFLRHGVRQLLGCDAVALLPGWERSTGARLEVQVGATCGMRVAPLAEYLDRARHWPRCDRCDGQCRLEGAGYVCWSCGKVLAA